MEREARGEGSMYSLLQPSDHPDLKQLVDRKIDVLSFMRVVVYGELKSVGRWCQGELLRVYEGRKHQTFRVLWDPIPDVGGYEESREGTRKFCQQNGRRIRPTRGEWMWMLILQKIVQERI